MRYRLATQNTEWFKLYELFISGIFHLLVSAFSQLTLSQCQKVTRENYFKHTVIKEYDPQLVNTITQKTLKYNLYSSPSF